MIPKPANAPPRRSGSWFMTLKSVVLAQNEPMAAFRMVDGVRAMKTRALLILLPFAFMASSPALAIDCAHKSTDVEKVICGNADLLTKDRALNEAYLKLLRNVADKEIRDVLIASQRRWLKAFDAFPLQKLSGGEFDSDGLTKAFDERIADLTRSEKSTDQKLLAPLVANIGRQTEFSKLLSGGSYSGFESRCNFVPAGHYICDGTETYQSKDRVCRVTRAGASSHITEYRTVATIVDNRVQMKATCSDGYANTSEKCPYAHAQESDIGWNMHPEITDGTPAFAIRRQNPFRKYDPDVFGRTEPADNWIRTCLSDPSYPQTRMTP